MNASLNQYQLDKKYNKFLLKLISWDIFYKRENRKKADEQAYQILEMMQCLDLHNLDLYNSHYPLIDINFLINHFEEKNKVILRVK
ncbi:hypothetical protein [Acinetobacter baumannii]|jgi:hypothetical protein|uniref:hypothetical protein n=1 Tax=Acinetobacter TaxID=469 RepID=UPI00347F9FB9